MEQNEKPPHGRFFMQKRKLRRLTLILHRCAGSRGGHALVAILAGLLVRGDQIDRRETYQDVDDAGEGHAEDASHAPGEQADEEPVEAADNDEDERDRVKCFHVGYFTSF